MSDVTPIEPITQPAEVRKQRVGFIRTLLRDSTQAKVGIGIVLVLSLIAIFAPLLAPYGPYEADPSALSQPPSSEHLLGTDAGGYDMLSLLIYGLRISIIVGIAAGTVAMLIGGTAGILAGYFGRKTDAVLMRTADFFLVVPELILMVIFAKIIGQGLWTIILVIGLLGWAGTARLTRAQTKSVKERVYVKRARAIGAGHPRILFRHILPQVTPLLVANAVLTVALAIFDETFLSFLGLGDPSSVSLGKLIENAFDDSASSNGYWWQIIPPGLLVTLLILGFTLFGQALEDALNPRLKVSYLSPRSWRIRRDHVEKDVA